MRRMIDLPVLFVKLIVITDSIANYYIEFFYIQNLYLHMI